jgi:hypothetical protein
MWYCFLYLLKFGHVYFQCERFFRPGATVVASVFAPIMYPPVPVVVFKETMHGIKVIFSLLYFPRHHSKQIWVLDSEGAHFIVATAYPSYILLHYKVDSDVKSLPKQLILKCQFLTS